MCGWCLCDFWLGFWVILWLCVLVFCVVRVLWFVGRMSLVVGGSQVGVCLGGLCC